jgi:hypothetical protein
MYNTFIDVKDRQIKPLLYHHYKTPPCYKVAVRREDKQALIFKYQARIINLNKLDRKTRKETIAGAVHFKIIPG